MQIAVVQVLPSGREVVVCISYTMLGAEKMLTYLVEKNPGRDYYIDCARTPDEVRAESERASNE